MRLEAKVAFISGGARGMGAVEASMFAAEGAKVAIGDVLEEGFNVAQEINQDGGDCFFVHLDVTSEAEWRAAIDETVSRYGRLDILVNNAGVSQWGLVHETSEEDWDYVMDINAKGVFLGIEGRHPRHDRLRRRLHHQHFVATRNSGHRDVERSVPGLQGSGQAPDQDNRASVRRT